MWMLRNDGREIFKCLFFSYLSHNVSVRTENFSVQSKHGSSKSRTGPVWAQVSQGSVHNVSTILWCAQGKAFMLCAGDQGRKKSHDSVSVDCHRYLKFITHFDLNSFLLTVHSTFFHSCKNFPTSLLSFLTPYRIMSHSFRSYDWHQFRAGAVSPSVLYV